MKKLALAAVASLCIIACKDDKAEEKKVMDKILAVHEKVMAADEQAVNNKSAIDSLLKADKFEAADSAAQKSALRTAGSKLNSADDAMSNWMHKFEPEYKAKSHADAMNYLNAQHQQIDSIDKELNNAIDQSKKLLSKYKK